jgi:hypothetical protein
MEPETAPSPASSGFLRPPPGAALTYVEKESQLPQAIEDLNLTVGRPVLILVGGADSINPSLSDRLKPLFEQAVVPAIERCGALVVDGGTDSGGMRLMGEARAAAGADFPLVGVFPAGVSTEGHISLQPNHTHFVMVPGNHWGDESTFVSGVASALAGGKPSIVLLVGGGDVTRKDVAASQAAGRTTITVAGSGGYADELAGSQQSKVIVFAIDDPPESLHGLIMQHLGGSMPKQNYRERLASQFAALVPSLNLRPEQRAFMSARWLDQIDWMEGRAVANRNYYYSLRGFTIVGGVIVPALVRLAAASKHANSPISLTTFILSLLVALSAAMEGFFKFGDRWRHYRRTAEALKSEGWQFIELSGNYRSSPNLQSAYKSFVQRTERLLQQDVDSYIAQVAAPSPAEGEEDESKEADT